MSCVSADWRSTRDTAYKPSVEDVFRRFPALGLVVHELVPNGDRLCMRFSEHGATASGGQACWARHRPVQVERQQAGQLPRRAGLLVAAATADDGHPRSARAARISTRGSPRRWQPSDPTAEATLRAWLAAGDLAVADGGRIDEVPVADHRPVLEPVDVEILDLFSAGDRVAFHATLRGTYLGGLTEVARPGAQMALDVAGLATVADGRIADLHAVTDRFGASLAMRPAGGSP